MTGNQSGENGKQSRTRKPDRVRQRCTSRSEALSSRDVQFEVYAVTPDIRLTRPLQEWQQTLIVVVIVVAVLRSTEIVFEYVLPNITSDLAAGLLIEAEVDAAIDARIADIVGDLAERGVVEGQARNGGIGHGDAMAIVLVDPPEHLGGAVACASVVGRVARETGRDHVRLERRVALGLRIPINTALENRRLWTPEIVVILRPERDDKAVVARHVDQREGARILRQRPALGRSDLSRGEVENKAG